MTSFPIALFLLLAAGIQYAVGGDNIFAPLRAPLPAVVRSLLECTACCGFWVGVGLQGVGLDIWPPALITGAAAVVIKCAGSGLAAAVGVQHARPGRRSDGKVQHLSVTGRVPLHWSLR